MSQCDYIQHKKIAHEMKDQANLGKVINPQTYTSFKMFDSVNTIKSTNVTFNQLAPTEKQRVFDMEMNVSAVCPAYAICGQDKNTRGNRAGQLRNLRMFTYCPNVVSTKGFFWSQKQKELLCLEKEFKQCDEYHYRRRIWFT